MGEENVKLGNKAKQVLQELVCLDSPTGDFLDIVDVFVNKNFLFNK